jgi:hypothetical protein
VSGAGETLSRFRDKEDAMFFTVLSLAWNWPDLFWWMR